MPAEAQNPPAARSCAPVVVLDFETTGMSPGHGDRITEVGAVRIEDGCITARFQSLVRTGVPVPPFIRQLTGISDVMLAGAPPAEEVLAQLVEFIGRDALVAHNASFDRRFLDAELALIGAVRLQPVFCTVLLSRRLLPQAPSHSLGALVSWLGLPSDGVHHRALADAEMTAHLWLHLHQVLDQRYGFSQVSLAWLQKLIDRSPRSADTWLRSQTVEIVRA